MILLSFTFFLFLFLLAGLLSSTQSRHTKADYLLAGHSVHPLLVALSAFATNSSGYMFIGVVGYTYVNGISAIWMLAGFLFGDFVSSFFIHKKLRVHSQKKEVLSFPELLATWNGGNFKILRKISAAIILIFLSIYAAAQFRAGGKALNVLFGWDYAVGSLIGALLVLLYCFAGGIRASIWTNSTQAVVMLFAVGVLFFEAVAKTGGFDSFSTSLQNISPNFLSFFPSNLLFDGWLGLALFVLGWFFGGFGIIGQPHVMTLFLTLNSPQNMMRVRLYYYTIYLLFDCCVIGIGLVSRVLIAPENGFDPELSLPTLAQMTLSEPAIGLILAGLFAATMSTADSQILSCSACITNDLLPKNKNTYRAAKLATLGVATFAALISLLENQSVFALVMLGWLALACSFAPLVTLYALGKKFSQNTGVAMLLCGFCTMLIWRNLGLGEMVYEAAPGILAGFLPYFFRRKK